MKISFLRRVLLFAPMIAAFTWSQAQITPTQLRVEHMSGDVLIEAGSTPRLSWINQAAEGVRGEKQTAYEICVSSSKENLNSDKADIWDSGKQKSSESYLVKYAGPQLKEASEYWWRVKVWNGKGKVSEWSEPQKFTMGLAPSSWKAKWIGAPWQGEEPQYSLKKGACDHENFPAPLLRKEFSAKSGIRSAKAFVTGLGYFELYLNGSKVSDDVLVPSFTNYGSRPDLIYGSISIKENSAGFHVNYLEYDVTSMLRNGQNAIGAIISGGYYDNRSGRLGAFGSPRFICQLEITYNDGSKETVVSDDSWKAHKSAIVSTELYDGENYDARLESTGWSTPDFNDSGWENVALRNAPDGTLKAQTAPTDKVIETFKPQTFTKNDDGSYSIDFGEVISGWIHFDGVKAEAGNKMSVKYESEYPEEVSYIFKDGEPINYTPKFTWYVFRTVRISGVELTADMVKAEAVSTNMAVNTEFKTDNDLFNKINAIWQRTEKDNIHSGIESDCPHRERIPYTGDGEGVCITVMHNFDASAFYQNWMGVMRDAQDKDSGYEPNSAPWCIAAGGGVAWGAAMTLVPWEYYLHYGDKDVLAENYEASKKQVEYMLKWKTTEGTMLQELTNARDNSKQMWLNLGDWVPAYDFPLNEQVHTYMLWRCADRLSKSAAALGKTADATHYREVADNVAKAYDKKFFKEDGKTYGDFGGNLFALEMGAANNKLDVMKNTMFNEIAVKYKRHLNTGFIGVGLLFEKLAALGLNDVAYDAMNQTDFPSFGNWIRQGATTFWEQFDGNYSRNHPFLGCALTWFYRSLAGVYADDNEPGYKHVIIRPTLANKLNSVHYAQETGYGRVASDVSQSPVSVIVRVTIPVGSHATVFVPANAKSELTINGEKAKKGKGVDSIKHVDGNFEVEVEQGTYELCATK